MMSTKGDSNVILRYATRKLAVVLVVVWVITSFAYILQSSLTNRQIKIMPLNQSFRDPMFAPILREYQANAVGAKLYPTRDIPTFLLIKRRKTNSQFWRRQLIDITADRCPLPCKFTDDISQIKTVDAVVFYLAAMKNRKHFTEIIPNRNLSQPWILLTFEAPLYANGFYHTKYSEFDGIFNRTASYRRDSDIAIPYGAVFSYNDAKNLPAAWRTPPPMEPLGKEPKKTAVAFISNCRGPSKRLDYIKQLQTFIDVDIYGRCGNLKCEHSRYVSNPYDVHTDKCYRKAASEYLFYLSFENSICKDYISEKVYNVMHYPIVPVVFGGADYEEVLPPRSYINALEFTPRKLAEYLQYLAKNRDEYNEYLMWRQYYQASTWGGLRPMCHICSRLYDPDLYKPNIVKNFEFWFLTLSQCSRHWEYIP